MDYPWEEQEETVDDSGNEWVDWNDCGSEVCVKVNNISVLFIRGEESKELYGLGSDSRSGKYEDMSDRYCISATDVAS